MLLILKKQLASDLSSRLGRPADILENLLETPKGVGHGHLALPVFAWAKEAKKAPPVLAAELASQLTQNKPQHVAKVEAASGFLNFSFENSYVQDLLMGSVHSNTPLGGSKLGEGKTVVIDYTSPNVAKPMHIGHLRSAVIGQAIANLGRLQGYKVIGLNHLGDWGVQFGKLAWAYKKWGGEYDFDNKPFESLFAIYVRFHEAAEKDPSLDAEGSKIFKRLEDGDKDIEVLWKKFVEISLKDYQRIWDKMNVRPDMVRAESFYNDRMKPVENELEKKGLLEESDGAMVVRLDDSDMPPCLIRKSDGASLYATRDLASAIYRMQELHADMSLYVVAADQSLHFRQVFKVLEKMGYPWTNKCHHIAFGLYRFKDAKFSTRKGNVIFLEEVLQKSIDMVNEIMAKRPQQVPNRERVAEQVGVGAIIFNDLVNDRVKNVEFDWDRVLDFEGDSGPYVQYCGVRCASLIRKYGKPIPQKMSVELNSPEEIELIRTLLSFDSTVRNAFAAFKPHYLAGFLIDVCHRFSQFYTKHRILGEDPAIESSRMALVQATHAILAKGLATLSIELPEAM